MKLRVARRAIADVDMLKTESLERWGARQTNRYLNALNATIARVIVTPLHFPSVHDWPPYRRARAGRHLVIFRVDEDAYEVVIVRILHERMDVDAQLDG